MVENGIPPTSGLQFLHTASDEILHLLGADICALPGVRPFGLRWAWVDGGRFGLLIGGVGVFAPEDSTEERHLRIRDPAIIGFCAAWPAMASSVVGRCFGDLFPGVNKHISGARFKSELDPDVEDRQVNRLNDKRGKKRK